MIGLTLPPSAERFRAEITGALSEWFGSVTVNATELNGGLSGAAVLKVAISNVPLDAVRPGEYILKVRPKVDDALSTEEAHTLAVSAAPDFAAPHMPQLLRNHRHVNAEAQTEIALLSVAGGSLRRFNSCSRPASELLELYATAIIDDITRAWSDTNNVHSHTAEETVRVFMGEHRFDDALALVAELFPESGMHYTPSGLILSPTKFFEILATDDLSPETVVTAMNHRDLHGGNILIDKTVGTGGYYLIDFDESARGLAGYDAAYLDVERFFRNCEGVDPATVRELVARVNSGTRDSYPASASAYLRVRDAIAIGEETAWRRDGWEDARRRQAVLARIAAALVWMRRRSMSPQAKRTLALYAGAQCALFLETYHANLLEKLGGTPSQKTPPEPAASTRAEWLRMRTRLGRLDGTDRKLILIAERDRMPDALRSLGLVPWQAVIDLDPMSGEGGLFSTILDNLESMRAVHRFSRNMPKALSQRGCAWMAANGWEAVGEAPPTDRDWHYKTLPLLREFGNRLHSLSGDTPVTVVVLGGVQAAPASGNFQVRVDKLSGAISVLDEAFGGRIDFITCGAVSVPGPADVEVYDLTQPDVAHFLSEELGTSAARTAVEIPGADGLVPLSPSLLATLNESFEVLHRHIGVGQGNAKADTEFVRGGTVGWPDLQDGADVPRDLYPRAVEVLKENLDSRRTRTVVLHHNPGAGGTTLARRLAWDLRLTNPVCVLHQNVPLSSENVPGLADRLKALYERAEQPVLCVAESSVLSESGREQLYRLLSSSGTRVVLLYVRRVFSTVPTGQLELLDPMSVAESDRFVELYRQVTDESRMPEVAKLSRIEYERYRSPFFFGLTAFERDFRSLESYVSNHVTGTLGRRREVVEYVAFATRYSEAGLDLSTIHRLLGFEPRHGLLTLAELFGDSAARLMVQTVNRVKIVHPIIADEVLDELVGGGRVAWRTHAHEIAQELIRALGTVAEDFSMSTMELLRQIFVERPGTRFDDVEDRDAFAPLIELLDEREAALGHKVLSTLTEFFPEDPHFWTHLGRHQIYRMNRDFEEAVGFVERAVVLSPEDPIHQHVLGQVNRFCMREIARQHRRQSSDDLLEVIQGPHEAATAAFSESRRLAPDNIYGYITHMQTTIEACKALAASSSVTAIAELGSPAVQDWVRENLSTVSELADSAATLYRTLDDRRDFLRKCLADLQRLYGDLDRAIELWEVAADSSGATSYGRRSLVHAYLARAERRWAELTQDQLARILELMKRNLRAPRATDEDYRLWFEAFRQSTEFNTDDALANLSAWKDATHAWRPSFYTSVLSFLLWFSGRSADLDVYDAAAHQSRTLALGRTRDSLLWLAVGPEACPLVGTDELGGWDPETRFWSETAKLRRVNGVIDQSITGPQAGSIVIDGGLRVFFVPVAGGFTRNADEGKSVNFYLAFTPEGPRAWDVLLGHLPGCFRRRVGDKKTINWAEREIVPTRARGAIGDSRVTEFLIQLVRARAEVGLDSTSVEALADRIAAVFGVRFGTESLTSVIQRIPELEWIDGPNSVALKRTMSELAETKSDENLHYGEVIEVIPPQNTFLVRELRRTHRVRAGTAVPTADVPFMVSFSRLASGEIEGSSLKALPKDTTVFDGRIIAREHLVTELAAYTLSRIDAAAGRGVSRSGLEHDLSDRYCGPGTLLEVTNQNSLRNLIASLPGIAVVNGLVGRAVRESVASVTDSKRAPNVSSAVHSAEVITALRTFGEVRGLTVIPLVQAGAALGTSLGRERYQSWRGDASLGKKLSKVPGLIVTKLESDQLAVKIALGTPPKKPSSEPMTIEPSEIVSVLRAYGDKGELTAIPLVQAGAALVAVFGTAQYQSWRGHLGLSKRLATVPGISVSKGQNDALVVTLTSPAVGNAPGFVDSLT
ncbi:aminoglycoside phosphotransferase family protein [Paenarthrobacter ilicis]|uniref:hypothetical protein n=1 Tax=Paenarthrobacter ilicis TaxID=43665 RepID=UPI00300A7791